MPTEIIPRNRWRDFLTAFSRSHADWLVTIEEVPPHASSFVVLHDRPLAGVSEDRDSLIIAVAGDSEHTDRIIDHPKTVRVDRSADGTERGLEIETESGETVRLRFRAAIAPELVDGI